MENAHPFDRFTLSVLTAPAPTNVAQVFADMASIAARGGLPHLDTPGDEISGYGLSGIPWDATPLAAAWDARVTVWRDVCESFGVDPYAVAVAAIDGDARPRPA